MDVAEPGRGIAPGLTVPILRALAGRSTPVTAAHLTRLTGRGTEAGVRRAVERLADHGVCLRDDIGGRVAYTLNSDHVLHRAVTELLRADGELPRRLRRSLAEWDPAPVSAVLFGSAARGDGDLASDIDVLLIRPPMRSDARRRAWGRQVNDLRNEANRWTGNRLQVLERSATQLRHLAQAGEPLVRDLRDDGVMLCGRAVSDVLGGAA